MKPGGGSGGGVPVELLATAWALLDSFSLAAAADDDNDVLGREFLVPPRVSTSRT